MQRSAGRLALTLLAPLFLYACSSNPTAPETITPPGPYADGLDHTWSASTVEAQRLYSYLVQGLKAQDFNIGLTVTATNGWGPIELNTSNGESAAGDGHTLSMKGKTYTTGLGVHAASEIHIHATGLVTPACTRFSADVGVDDEVGENGKYSSVIFQVFADGEKLYDSGVMSGISPTQHIDVPVGGKSDLRFVVSTDKGNTYYDHADWAAATLSCDTQQQKGGALDPSFQRINRLVPQSDSDSTTGIADALAQDGSLYLRSENAVYRYHTDGTPDTSFGDGGKISVAGDSPGLERITLLPSGQFLVNTNFGLSRYNSNGTLDTSFNKSGSYKFGYFVRTIALQTDGKIVASGNSSDGAYAWTVQRLNADGSLDTGFGVNGKVNTVFYDASTNQTQKSAISSASLIEKNGKILIAGSSYFASPSNQYGGSKAVLASYNNDGSQDNSFGLNGQVIDAVVSSSVKSYSNKANALAVTGAGKIIIAGSAMADNGSGNVSFDGGFVTQYLENGARDTSFGAGGAVISNSNGDNSTMPCRGLTGLGVQKDGKILVSGSANYNNAPQETGRQACVKRLLSDGSLDSSFDRVAAEKSSGEALLIQPDGRFIVGLNDIIRIFP